MASRNSAIELLRIISMVFIVLWHFIFHGFSFKSIGDDGFLFSQSTLFQAIICSVISFSVNTFIFISGYYGIKFKVKNIVFFYVQAISILLIVFTINYFLTSKYYFIDIVRLSFPIISYWWFFRNYFILYILSPLIEQGLTTISKKNFIRILLFLFFINTAGWITGEIPGSGLFNMLFIYLVARYFSIYNINFKKYLFLVSQITLVLLISFSWHSEYGKVILRLLSFNNPLIIISSISIFYIFAGFTLKSMLINKLAKYAFAVYLISDAPYVQKYLNVYVANYIGLNIILLVLTAILIYIICAILEHVRMKLFDKTVNCVFIFITRNKWI